MIPGRSKQPKTGSNISWILLASLAVTGCASHPAIQAGDDYAAPTTCSRCHAQIAAAYRQTGMGRSFYRPTSQSVPAPATFHHNPSRRDYEIAGRDGKFYQSRHQIGYGNRPANHIEKQIDFIVGSGSHARTFLHRNPDGQLIEMPLSWYSEKGGYVAMSPGYDNTRPEDFRRPVPDDCLFCHNGYPATGVLAEGIDCQRCHGPGKAHVDSSGRAPIVNPAKLDRDRQLDNCMQCHLETTSLRLPNAIRLYDRAPFSYRPGQPLTDYQLFFNHAPKSGYDNRFEVAHQAYRLRQSACFLKSQMTCTTCHDPHQVQTADHFIAVCRSCHTTAHSTGDCLGCHMWKRRTDDAVHVVMTDHFIQRRKPSRDLLAPVAETSPVYGGEVVPYYPARSAGELYAAVAQVEHEANLAAGIPRLEQALAQNNPANPEYYVELGKALLKSGRQEEAIRSYEEALRHRDGFHPALRELAAALALAGNFPRAIEVGERAAAQQPPDTVALTNLANAYLRQGNADRARQLLEQALALNPDLPDAQNLLGLAWLSKRDARQAETAFRTAIAIQPDMAEPHNNLANLLAGQRDFRQAAYHFELAISDNPLYADAHHGYGLLLVLTHSYAQALTEFQQAARLDPASPQTHLDLADALSANGRAQAAADEYTRALLLAKEGSPEYDEAHLSLGTMLARNGRMKEARPHLQRAAQSGDPDIRQAALQALR